MQILVEIAEHQPAVRQQEIAEKLGVTPQAISEYIRELVDEGMVSASGRGNYEVTKSGIEWVLANAESLESYARHIRRDIIQQVSVWTAIAAEDLRAGDEVGVYMKAGFLYAGKQPLAATGSVVADAKNGRGRGGGPPERDHRPPRRGRPRLQGPADPCTAAPGRCSGTNCWRSPDRQAWSRPSGSRPASP